jgi:cell division transport system permease protein
MRSSNKGSVIYAILSNTIVLVLIGFFSILYLHTNSITNLVKEKISILVELKSDTLDSNPKQLINLIQSNSKIVPGSVKFIKKEYADTIIGLDISKNLSQVGNPFHDIISFNVKSEFYSESNIQKIKTELKKRPEVFDVFYEHVVIDNLKDNLRSISFIVLMLSLVFVFLALVIIFNTINLSLYADRWEIKTMEIIGARDSFIRQPYIKLAGGIALKSFSIAAILLLSIVAYCYYKIQDASAILNWFYILISIIFIFVISIVITVSSTIAIVNKYLYKNESDLY